MFDAHEVGARLGAGAMDGYPNYLARTHPDALITVPYNCRYFSTVAVQSLPLTLALPITLHPLISRAVGSWSWSRWAQVAPVRCSIARPPATPCPTRAASSDRTHRTFTWTFSKSSLVSTRYPPPPSSFLLLVKTPRQRPEKTRYRSSNSCCCSRVK